MNTLKVRKEFIKSNEFNGNKDIEKALLPETMVIFSAYAFANCESLKEVYFGVDITRIGNLTFENCKNLTDLWFAITDEDKFIEIASDAFDGCDKEITFHIFASAINNKYLNSYAKRHGFKVVGMI